MTSQMTDIDGATVRTPPRRTPLPRESIREVTPPSRWGPARRYVLALAFTAVALGLTLLLDFLFERTVFLLFWPAIIAAAWFGGFGPALVSIVVAIGLVDFFVIPPAGSFKATTSGDTLTLVGFFLVSTLVSWAISQVERERRRAEAAAVENARLARLLDEQAGELSEQLEEAQSMQEELEQSTEELAERTAEAEAAERFIRGILESISDPFVVHDDQWRFRYLNDAASRAVRSSGRAGDGDLTGRVVWDVWPELQGSIFETEMTRAARDRVPVTFEAFNAERGTWAELFCYPLPDGGLGTQWKDITARKQAEESARYLATASSILSASLDYETTLSELAHLVVPHFADWCAISILDGDGEAKQLAVAHVDPEKVKRAHELNKRYPPDQSASTGVPQVIRTGQPELYPEIPDSLLVAAAIDDEHLALTRELGLKSAMVVPLTTASQTFGAITIVSAESGRRYGEQDLAFATELARRAALAIENAKHHKAELDARHAAESANAAKTQFLAVMSHELRTPLNAIGGYAELLLMGLRGAVTPEQQADLERIQRSQRNLLSLINDILNYAKLEGGHVEFSMADVPLHPFLLELEPLVTPQLNSRRISYSYAGCSDSLSVWADPEKMRQIFLNLLSNAVKFTDPGGSISIDCKDGGETVTIVVTDTGHGIAEDKHGSVFEPFVQVERKLTSGHEGTGLGLAISRDLARGMGGELAVQSSLGKGSSFLLTLRKAPA
jgi:PAS domain S-box-containing protein